MAGGRHRIRVDADRENPCQCRARLNQPPGFSIQIRKSAQLIAFWQFNDTRLLDEYLVARAGQKAELPFSVHPHMLRHYLPFLTMSGNAKNSTDMFENAGWIMQKRFEYPT